MNKQAYYALAQPPSGGCVLKHQYMNVERIEDMQPPSGGCVLKPPASVEWPQLEGSRLRAAVC